MSIFAPEQPYWFGEVNYQNGGHFGPLLHSYLDLLILYEGAVDITVDGETRHLIAGNVCLVFNETAVDYELFGHTHYIWCETGELVMNKDVRERIKSLPHTLPIWPRIDTLQKLGASLGKGEGENFDNLRNSLGTAVFFEYFHQANLLETERPLAPGIQLAKRFIEQHYTEDNVIGRVTNVSGLTHKYLIASFQKHLNITPTRYLWQLRTEHGMNLIIQTDLSIGEIAGKCGFQNQFHFSRFIKQHYGHSPTRLRKRSQERLPSIAKGTPVDIAYKS